MTTETRELKRDGFFLAEKLWEQYRGQKAYPDLYFDRILSRVVNRTRMIIGMEPGVPGFLHSGERTKTAKEPYG